MSTEQPIRPGRKKLLYQLLGGLVILFLLVVILAYFLHEPIVAFSRIFVERFGHYGIFLGILITDTSPLPLTHEPLLFLGVSGGLDVKTVIITGSLASITAGMLGYICGLFLSKTQIFLKIQEKDRYQLQDWIHQKGVWIVAAGAISPLPFAMTTWIAGAIKLPFYPFFFACLLRIPKVAFYLWLILYGWNLGLGI